MGALKLCSELNTKVIKLARVSSPNWGVSDNAPGTFDALMASTSSPLIVWSGASQDTIYGDASVNHAFRAWHDSIHIKQCLPFTLEGEAAVARIQANEIGGQYADIILAEIDAQAQYFSLHGKFPEHQLNFMLKVLSKGVIL